MYDKDLEVDDVLDADVLTVLTVMLIMERIMNS